MGKLINFFKRDPQQKVISLDEYRRRAQKQDETDAWIVRFKKDLKDRQR